jgi:hypothetical protein
VGVLRVKIYEVGVKIYADIDYADQTRETIQWNFTEDRKRVLELTDGYTLFADTRVMIR